MYRSKNKIAFTIPTMESGGMERVMSEVLAYFSTIPDVTCHLIIYGKPTIDFYKIPDNVVIYKPSFKFDDDKRTWSTFKTLKFLRDIVKTIKPDVVLSFGEYWNNFVLLSLFGLGLPVFISDRSSPEKSLGLMHDFLRKLLYPLAAGIIAQTGQAKEIIRKKLSHENIKVIGNPIRNISVKGIGNRENVIVTVGRLISTKNFDRLINVFARLGNADWKLVIIGGDSDKQLNSFSLQAQIDRLGLAETVHLVGKQKDVESYLISSKIFAFTSSSEGFPNVIGEAMSAGLPVVSYNCVAGPSDMIEDGKNGFLVPVFDDELFERRLNYLMGNEEERACMGLYATESIKKFSVDKIGKDYFDFIMN